MGKYKAPLPAPVVGIVESLTRLNNSTNGNPRYLVHFTNGSAFPTAPDASLSYGIANPEYRDHAHTFTLDRLNRITMAEIVK